MRIKSEKQNTHTGFTIVETLVAITILLLVIIGPMTAAQKGIQQSYFSNEQIVATFLAQEGIEAIREFRDEWALSLLDGAVSDSDGWVSTVEGECSGSIGCLYDSEDNIFQECNNFSQCEISIVDGKYVQDGTSGETGYTRTIQVNNDGDSNLEIISTVSWNSGVFGGSREAVVQSWVYDQYRRYED